MVSTDSPSYYGKPKDQAVNLLIKCRMSHDACCFMAVAGAFGMEVTNRINQIAARIFGVYAICISG